MRFDQTKPIHEVNIVKHLQLQLLNAATIQIRSSTLGGGVCLPRFLNRMLIPIVYVCMFVCMYVFHHQKKCLKYNKKNGNTRDYIIK